MDESLQNQLGSLGEGEELVTIENGEEVVYINPQKPKICVGHEFADVGNNEKICIICGQGRVG